MILPNSLLEASLKDKCTVGNVLYSHVNNLVKISVSYINILKHFSINELAQIYLTGLMLLHIKKRETVT